MHNKIARKTKAQRLARVSSGQGSDKGGRGEAS